MMTAEKPGDIEGDDEEGALRLEDLGEVERCGIFVSYHNSIIGHLSVGRTLKSLSLVGWDGICQDITRMIYECSICQKLKHQREEPNWEDMVDHHIYSLVPLTSL